MKIIDKTPLLDEKGELGIVQRVQGMLQFGFNWPRELQAQKVIVTFLDRQLEKGYTLIRNYSLGQSGIMIPIILLGPTGIYVIQITHLRGHYEVKGDSWNVASGDGYKPAPVNLVQRTMRMAKALAAFIERQGVRIPVEIEAVLIAADPGMHIESVRPAIKVMMIDGIKSFVSNLSTGRPIISSEKVFDLSEHIVNPRHPKKEGPAPSALSEPDQPAQEVSRARAIFDASQEAKPFNPSDFDFAMLDEEPAIDIPPVPKNIVESNPALPLPPRARTRGKRILGMTPIQLAILAALALTFLCIMAGFAYYVLVLS